MNIKIAQLNSSTLSNIEQQIGLNFAGQNVGNVVSDAVRYFFPIAGLTMLLYLLYGGYQFLLSGGDPKAIEAAKGKITHALIGFFIVFASYWIVQIMGAVLGINAINSTF